MQVVSHYHPDGDESMEMDDRPVNNWDWQAVGDKHDIDGLKTKSSLSSSCFFVKCVAS